MLTPLTSSHKTLLRTLPLMLLLVVALYVAGQQLLARLAYEASGPFTWDSTIYWAVGRGILNDLHPWRDLFETKPPGIFLISALSWQLTDSTALCHWLQVVAILMVAALPPALLLRRTPLGSRLHQSATLLALVLAGVVLSQYVAERSGEVQVESFGIAAATLALWVMANPSVADHRWGVAVSSVGFLGACGLKEPFVLSLLAAALLLLRTREQWWRALLLPLLLAIAAGAVLLLLLGWLGDYLQHYLLGYMLGTYTSHQGSPWQRALQLPLLWRDLNEFAPGLGYAALFTGVALAMRQAQLQPSWLGATLPYLRLLLAGLLTSLAVGLGGEYYNHHFVFMMPLVLALIALLINEFPQATSGLRATTAGVVILLSWSGLSLPTLHLPERLAELQALRRNIAAKADYVDTVMTASGESRYVFLGSNGPQLFAFTRHSPMGPMFFQLPDIVAASPTMRAQYLQALQQTNVVVVEGLVPELAIPASAILNRDFTPEPWAAIAAVPRPGDLNILFRRGAH